MVERVVVTGMGIISCLGNNCNEVKKALFDGRSGITACENHIHAGMRSHIAGTPQIDLSEHIDRKKWRFMGDAAGYAYLSLEQAAAQAQLKPHQISHPRTGIVAGSGGGSTSNQVDAADILRDRGIRRVGPYRVTQTMSSTVSACLATPFQIKGINYSISSACSTSAHCIGHAMELIQLGKQDIVFAGGGEELHWTMSALFDAMGALSTQFNETPELASRAYDADRDGFVIAGGGGILVLESLSHAVSRDAPIIAEIVGYAATSDGSDMVAPSGEGAVRCMQLAMGNLEEKIDYINAHGTSTPAGDIQELNALRSVFDAGPIPTIGSTKSLSGHSLGAAGVQEAIYSLLMMQNNFIAASANIERLDDKAKGLPIAIERIENATINQIMSNSFGFGGTNATLIFQRPC